MLSVAYLESGWSCPWGLVLGDSHIGTSGSLEFDFEFSGCFCGEDNVGLDVITTKGNCYIECAFDFDLVLCGNFALFLVRFVIF
jgi:hypothetical protein